MRNQEASRRGDKPIAYEAYQELAPYYAARIDTKPHNAYYDRPAMLSLLPSVDGRKVLDVGCGPGAYAEALVERGADVIGIDVSEKMLSLAEERLEGAAIFRCVDVTLPLDMFADASFDLVLAALCLDYVEDWNTLFAELYRILKPGGHFLFSCGHAASDAEYFQTDDYFSVEEVKAQWTGFGKEITMPGFRRPLHAQIMPLVETGFQIEKVVEPQPTEEFRRVDPVRFESLTHRPAFICFRSRKPQTPDRR